VEANKVPKADCHDLGDQTFVAAAQAIEEFVHFKDAFQPSEKLEVARPTQDEGATSGEEGSSVVGRQLN
jgi:hypothetical protein